MCFLVLLHGVINAGTHDDEVEQAKFEDVYHSEQIAYEKICDKAYENIGSVYLGDARGILRELELHTNFFFAIRQEFSRRSYLPGM